MPAGNQREALLRVADQLCAELGYAAAGPKGATRRPRGGGGAPDMLSPEDEALVAGVRRGLEKIAVAAGADEGARGAGRAVSVALDGAEIVMRGELATGSPARLPALMPSFVFLVTLPIVDQDEALDLSRRTLELIETQQRG